MANNEEKLIYYTPEMIMASDYYQFPKWLMGVEINNDCKVLYMLLLDRYKLSLKNKWIDDENRVYSYFSKESAANILKIGISKCYELFSTLENKGFIEQIRQGQGKNNRLYLKSVDFTEFSQTYEIRRSENDDTDYRPQTYEKHRSKPTKNGGQDLRNSEGNKNDSSKNKENKSTSTNSKDLTKVLNAKTNVDGMMVTDRQYKDINDMIQMIATREIKDTTKADLLKFLHKLYNEEKQDFLINDFYPIRNLKGFIRTFFNEKTDRDIKELEDIKELASHGNEWAIEFMDENPSMFKKLEEFN